MLTYAQERALQLSPEDLTEWRKKPTAEKHRDIVEWRTKYDETISTTARHFGVSPSYVGAAWRKAGMSGFWRIGTGLDSSEALRLAKDYGSADDHCKAALLLSSALEWQTSNEAA